MTVVPYEKPTSLLFLIFNLGIFSQIEAPIKWSTAVEKVSVSEYILRWKRFAQSLGGGLEVFKTINNKK